MKAELKHWRAFPANIGLEAAPVLEFTNRMALLAVHSTKYRMDSHTLHSGDTMLRRPRLLIVPLSVLLFSVFAGIGATPAAPPATLNYQGDLANASSQPVSNGALTMTFRLYDAATAGNLLYSETQTVSVASGLFNVRIGAVTPIALPFDVPYFLGVTVGADAEMTPRQPLSSSAYAFRASSADALAPAATVAGSQITGSITTATIPAANVIGGVGGSGTVTSVATGAGLSGGPITASGTINLAATNLLPTTACAANQIPKWNGTAWACAADADTNSGGTVTSVATGSGLTGGTIITSGTIGLAATNLLPTTACATNQIAKWNGSAWACAADASVPAGGVAGQVLIGSAGGPAWSTTIAPGGNIELVNSTASVGNLLKNGQRFLHNTGTENVFLGTNSGSLSTTGTGLNVAIGSSALSSVGTGSHNVAVGNLALTNASSGISNTAVGASALISATSAHDNVGIGAFALFDGTTAYQNTAVGFAALPKITTGFQNIALGTNAGFNLTTGDNNIVIGNNGGLPTESNTTRIGDSANQYRTFIAGIRGVLLSGGTPLPVLIDANGQLGTGPASGGGTVTSVATGSGLTGGTITSTGTINLAATNLLPTTACAADQIPKWDGTAWACATDAGSVTSVATGSGLTGGPITATGTIGLAATNLLPTTACTTNQIAKWNGSAWACAIEFGATGTGQTLDSSGTLTRSGTTMFRQLITNLFVGTNAGPATDTGGLNVGIGPNSLASLMMVGLAQPARNTAIGHSALDSTTSGKENTALGYSALSGNTTGERNLALGWLAGFNLTTGSNNIVLANQGVAAESNTIRIGFAGNQTRAFIAGIHNVAPAGASPLPVIIDADGQLGTSAVGFGTVTSVATGAGLTGGPITASGTINLAATNLLPTTACGTGQIARWSGSAWGCTGGGGNTGIGANTLVAITSGTDNVAIGKDALDATTTGNLNTAVGIEALTANVGGATNTAIGARALQVNIGGSENTALGIAALDSNTTGTRNIGIGLNGGASLTTGNHNIAIANEGVAGESGTIRLGDSVNQTRAFIAGIRGITTGSATGISVLIDTNGQLGTVSSSRNVKNHITDIGNDSDVLMNLRPVSFRYKSHDSGPRQYGLIAEEVAEVAPELVARREDGSVETVYYQHLPPMLLNEVQKQRRIVEALKAQNAAIAAENAALRADVASIKATLGLPPGLR